MRKALFPLIASLALCGAATVALVATNARAEQSPQKPVMMTLADAPSFAAETAAPPAEGGMPGMDMRRGPRDRGAMLQHMCNEMVARKAGELAYLETKLALTPAQAPLFARWKGVMQDIAQKRQAECAARPARQEGEHHDLLAGLAMKEKFLKTRLANLEAERPPLTALYAALTPEQKMEFAHAAHHGREGRMHRMMGMMGRGMGGMMGHPPMGRGPDGAPLGGPGAPPPAQ